MSFRIVMKDNSILKAELLKKPTETVKAVVALTQPDFLHPARALSEETARQLLVLK